MFLLPGTFFSFPVRRAIVPKVKVDIEHGSDDTPKMINSEAKMLGGHIETKVIVAKKFDMKTISTTPQTGLKGKSNIFFR